jgi:hypothetical protein
LIYVFRPPACELSIGAVYGLCALQQCGARFSALRKLPRVVETPVLWSAWRTQAISQSSTRSPTTRENAPELLVTTIGSAGRKLRLEVHTMWLIDALAEKKIQEAIERGELDDLPGAGRPLPEDDLSRVPEHLRAGYRLLKNAGFLPPELRGAAQLKEAEDLLGRIEDPAVRAGAQRQLRLLQMRLRETRGHGLDPGPWLACGISGAAGAVGR